MIIYDIIYVFCVFSLKLYQLSQLSDEYNKIDVYRLGDHVDICSPLINQNNHYLSSDDSDFINELDSSPGPFISSSSQFGPFSITAVS